MNASHVVLSGKKFGKGTVIKQVPKPIHLKRNGFYWLVQCECGETRIVDTTTLKTKWTNCGCVREEDLVGKKFSFGTVVKLNHKYAGYRYWLLQCDCGNQYKARTESLVSGNTKSCGCLNKRIGKNHPHYTGCEDLSGEYWTKLKRGAKRRKLEFEIDMNFAWDLYISQEKKCALTGWDISLADSSRHKNQTASLDRKNSDIGYITENVQWVHKDINRMKQNFHEDYLLEMCKAIIERGNH